MSLEEDQNCGSADTSSSVYDLIIKLRSSFLPSEYQHTADTVAKREEHMHKKCIELEERAEAAEKALIEKDEELRKKLEAAEKEKDTLFSKNQKLTDDLQKKQKAVNDLTKQLLDYKDRINFFWKNLTDRATILEKTAKELKDSKRQEQNCAASEGSRPPGFDKKEGSTKRKQDVIEIDDDEDDGDHLHISTLKRKRFLNEVKIESDVDLAEIFLTETQKGKNLQESLNQSVASHSVCTPSGSMQEERWSYDFNMVEELDQDDELCVHAVCALYRQKIHGKEKPDLGPHLVPAYDASRIPKLINLLTEWDPLQNPKKKAFDMDPFIVEECRKFAKKYSSLLFIMYQDKEDPFFPPPRAQGGEKIRNAL